MNNENIYDVNMENFQNDVIEQSMTTPVVVDFWADWCQPCKELMPALETIINENAGKIKLAKINIDENKEMAQQMQVRSVPTVAIIYKGKPVDGFNGNIPKSEINEKIKKVLSSVDDSNDDGELNQLLETANDSLKQNDYDSAMGVFMQALEIDGKNPIAVAGLAKCYINMGELDGAESILSQAEDDENENIVEAKKLLEITKSAGDVGEIDQLKSAYENNPNDMQCGLDYAIALFGSGNHQGAIDLLLDLYKIDKNWNEELVKTKILEYFEVLGFDNPISIEGRKRLSTLMFV